MLDVSATLTLLYTFPSTASALYAPTSVVQGSDGSLYATAQDGGSDNAGAIVKLARDGTLSVLHIFSGSTDGSYLNDALTLAGDGNFYGVAESGGASNFGTLFKLTPTGDFTVLHTFTNAIDKITGVSLDVGVPQSSLILAPDGFLYGIAQLIGNSGQGAIFRSDLAGHVEIVLDFANTPLQVPLTLRLGRDGIFYGTTSLGPTGQGAGDTHGAIYSLTTSKQFTILHAVNASIEGGGPILYLQGGDGAFYGATGGTKGKLFRFLPDGTFTILYAFKNTVGNSQPQDDGVSVNALVQTPDGTLCGVNSSADPSRYYSHLFAFQIDTGTYTNLLSLTYTAGAMLGSLIYSPLDGTIYGVASGDGLGGGTIRRVNLTLTPVVQPSVSIAATVPSVTDGSGQDAEMTLTLSSAATTDLHVAYSVKGTAQSGTDYVALKGAAKIKAGKTSKAIKVVPLGDGGGLSKRTVKLTVLPGTGYEIGTSAQAKVKLLAPSE